jgi:hypothetical protein
MYRQVILYWTYLSGEFLILVMETASRKVPDGKLVKVEVEAGEKLERVKIRGDFFIEPPEALKKIQESLEGLEAGFSREEVESRVEEVDADLIGFSAEDIATCLEEAVRGEDE